VNKSGLGFFCPEKLGSTMPIFSANQGLTLQGLSRLDCGVIGKSLSDEYMGTKIKLV
jgi:hypothetical protein